MKINLWVEIAQTMAEAGSNIRAGKERKSFGQNPPHRVIHLVLQDQVGSPSLCHCNLKANIHRPLHSNILKGSSPRRKIDLSSLDTVWLFYDVFQCLCNEADTHIR